MTSLKTAGLGLIGALAMTAASAPAQAADIGRDQSYKDPVPVIDYLPAIGWTGFYIGANVGAVWDDSNDVDIADDATLIAGGHLGYNWQGPRNLVIGVEGDLSYLDDVEYLATIRGRLGYAMGSTLLYATGGAAFIGFDEDQFGDDTDTGWVAGLGFEHKLRQNVSFGLEGLYYGFEGEDEVGDDADANFWAARARLTYHFGGRGEALK